MNHRYGERYRKDNIYLVHFLSVLYSICVVVDLQSGNLVKVFDERSLVLRAAAVNYPTRDNRIRFGHWLLQETRTKVLRLPGPQEK